jgi:predicted acylesterase/phospholipase RssA
MRAIERLERRLERLAGPWGVWSLAAVVAGFVGLFDRYSRGYVSGGGPTWTSLQLAFDPGTFRHVLTLWAAAPGPDDAMGAARSTIWQLDFLFPIACAMLASAAYWWFLITADLPSAETGPTTAPAGEPTATPAAGSTTTAAAVRPPRILLLLPWTAVFFDLVENALLLWLIPASEGELATAAFSPSLVWMMSVAAAFKWTFVILSVLAAADALFSGPRGRVLTLTRYGLLSIALGSLPLAVSDQGLDLVTSLAESDRSADWIRLLIAAWLWAASVWYWSRVILDAAGASSTSRTYHTWTRWTPRVLGTLTLAAPSLAFVKAIGRPQGSMGVMSPSALAWIFLVSAGVFLALVVLRRRLIRRLSRRHTAGFSFARLAPATQVVVVASMAVSLTLFAFMVARPVPAGAWLGAPTILVIAAANTVFFGSLAVFASQAWRLPLDAIAFGCAAVFSLWNDNHEVRIRPAPVPIDSRSPVTVGFARWTAVHPDGPVVIVAAEGGGIRAAYWTAAVLAKVHTDVPETRTRLFAVSGVSGGSVGAAVYAALVRDGRNVAAEAAPLLARGFLAPVLAKMVTGDFLQWLLPIPVPAFDRSLGLEEAMAAAYRGDGPAARPATFDAAFLDLQPDARAGVPALYLTSVSVETGARVIASPFAWPRDVTRRDRIDVHDLTEADFSLAAAVHNSARFTYISPAGRLRSARGEDRGHVVDGGYFENTGIETAIDLMDAVDPARARRFILLVLCNTPGGCVLPAKAVEPQPETPPAPAGRGPAPITSWRKRQSLGELLSPVRALLATREMRGRLARARLDRRADAIEFGVCQVDDGRMRANAPLGWQLSAGARQTLDAQIEHCTRLSIEALRVALAR